MVNIWKFNVGQEIIRENETGETGYIIESGKVEISKLNQGRKVHIAYLEKGATFGEMSMIDDQPRSATVTALEPTEVREFHRDDLFAAMKDYPEAVATFLKSIFVRLREANAIIAKAQGQIQGQENSAPKLGGIKDPEANAFKFYLEGLTPQAVSSISPQQAQIKNFPFKIGRKSSDPFLYNHLEVEDHDPVRISRHHVSLIWDAERVGVVDRGSALGASVDGKRIGGKFGPGPVFFENKEGVLILGDEASPYQYRLKVSG